MKKYISAVLVLGLVLTMLLAGIPGVAKADSTVELSLNKSSVETTAGSTVSLTAAVTNGYSEALTDFRVVYGSQVFDGEPLAAGESKEVNISLVVTSDMIGKDITLKVQYETAALANWQNGGTDTISIKEKVLSVQLDTSVKASKEIADSGDTVTFTFKLENNGEADITDIVVKAPDLNSGKALKDKFSLASGKSYSFKYTYTMKSGDITVTPKITYTANGESHTINKDPITVTLSKRDVQVSATVSNNSPQAGEEVTFNLTIANNGNVSYSGLKVTLNGEEVDFPATRLKPGDSYDETYTRTFEASTDVTFSVTMKDQNGEQKNVSYGPIQIELPVDSSIVNDKLKLIMNVDRPQLTSAGAINFTGYISNATDYDFTNLQVNEASLGNVYSATSLEASGQANIEWTADVNATTTYNFVLTATDKDGNNYTINAEPITVTVQSVTPTPTNFEDAANVTDSGQVLGSGKSSFDWSKFFLILAIVLVVLIVGVGAALIVLWKKGKTPGGGRPTSGRPSSSRRPAPRPSSPTPARKKPSGSSYGRGGSPRKPSGSKSYHDRNNF